MKGRQEKVGRNEGKERRKKGRREERRKEDKTEGKTGSRAEGKSLFLKGEQRSRDNLEERIEVDVAEKGRQEKVVKRRVDRRKVNQKK